MSGLAAWTLLTVLSLGADKGVMDQVRHWAGAEQDDGSVHCLGNGRLCVYEQGPDIIQAFGPPYSAGSVLRLEWRGQDDRGCQSTREPGAAIWNHQLTRQGAPVGRFLDFVDASLPCFVRHAAMLEEVTLTLHVAEGVAVIPNPARYDGANVAGALLLTVPAGHYLYPPYPTPWRTSYQLVVTGNAVIAEGGQPNTWTISLRPGDSVIHLAGGPSYPEVVANMTSVLTASLSTMTERTRAHWQAFTARRRDFASLIPADAPERQALLQAIDDVAVTIKTQEAEGGGVLAGYPYHLLYVRDQYGVARCLLKLGYFDEARGILERDWAIWQKHGKLRNAQAAGVDGVFHVHENDDVEITGYLLIQAFDYATTSGDAGFLDTIFPMLEWAWMAQQKHLAKNMLPFNGDETYVAGGILPRSTLNDGSAEATLLFITGGEKLLAYAAAKGRWDAARLDAERTVLNQVRDAYLNHFVGGGQYITNNPARRVGLTLPPFRHGVCERCIAFGWTEKTDTDRYVCPACAATTTLPRADDKVYHLLSVGLLPLYIEAELPGREVVTATAQRIVEQFEATGKLPSRPDGDTAVGYDPGLLLFTLTELNHPAAQAVYARMMAMRDPVGVWVEYYQNGEPRGTRCRPWESGINLEAALHYIEKQYGG